MIETVTVARWAAAAQIGDDSELSALWVEIAPAFQLLCRAWVDSELQRSNTSEDELSRFLDQILTLKRRGEDELMRLIAAVAVTRQGDKTPSIEEFANAMTNHLRPLLDELADPELESVAMYKLKGLKNDHIADLMNRTRRTIQRQLKLIREIWESHLA